MLKAFTLRGTALALVAAVSLMGAAERAEATTFTVGAGSSVDLTPRGGFLSGCTGPGDCITESLASGLVGYSFDLINEGDYATFDFLTFTANGSGFYEEYDATATLAFSMPLIGASSGGFGGVYGVLSGSFAGGVLSWDDVPIDVAFGNTGIVSIDFQDGLTLFAGSSVTTTATVTLVRADLAPVPLPAGGLLLLTGLGAVVAMRHRKKAA